MGLINSWIGTNDKSHYGKIKSLGNYGSIISLSSPIKFNTLLINFEKEKKEL